jgi:hypothetical protein
VADAVFTVKDRGAIRQAAWPGVGQVASRVESAARSGTPVRTGRLRAGWRVERGRIPGVWLVVNDVPYARWVEYGTGRRRPAAMLGRAAARFR